MATKADPTEAIRLRAAEYAGVDTGTACTQSSFKVNGVAFLFIGAQGGRFKAMFKLDASRADAIALAKAQPDDVQVGSGAWVTVRFSAETPIPKRRWTAWLDESYALASASKKPRSRKTPTPRKAGAKKPATKKSSRASKASTARTKKTGTRKAKA